MAFRGRKRTYDRIKIREHSHYWKASFGVQPPMQFDSSVNLLTIYGSGINHMKRKGLEVEELTGLILNHEILHDVINETLGFVANAKLDIFERHWPFYWGIDYIDGEWFAPLMLKMGYHLPASVDYIKNKLKL